MSSDETEAHDPKYEPVVSLPELKIPSMEEDEDVLFKMRAKLFRWAKESDPPEWKERGTGDVKLLKHKETSKIRLVMRRDKTFKTCANHYLDTKMELVPNHGSDRAWVWTTFADFTEEVSKEELLAIRFLNSENANKFKDKFCECQEMLRQTQNSAPVGKEENAAESSDDDVAEKLEKLKVEEDQKENPSTSSQTLNAVGDSKSNSCKSVEDSPEK